MKSAVIANRAEKQAAFFLLIAGCPLVLAGLLPPTNLLALSLLFVALTLYVEGAKQPAVRQLAWLAAFFLGVFVATYRPAGFEYPLVARADEFYPGGAGFQLYLNFAKAFAGLMVIAFLLRNANRPNFPLFRRPAAAAVLVAGSVLAVILLAVAVLELPWQPKLPAMTACFVLINVAVTCVAEEAFFRLLLQQQMMHWFASRYLAFVVPVLITAVLFALVHHPVPDAAFVVYLGAGAAYALVYALTGRLAWAVAVHAGVNLTHFLFLPYPLPV